MAVLGAGLLSSPPESMYQTSVATTARNITSGMAPSPRQ